MNPVKKTYNYLSGKNLKNLYNQGAAKQKEVFLTPFWKRPFSSKYNRDLWDLNVLDKKYTKDKRKLRMVQTGLVGGTTLPAAHYLTKEGSSRILNLLKSKRQKKLDSLVNKMDKVLRDGPVLTKSAPQHVRYDKLRKALAWEKTKTTGKVGLGLSLPVLGYSVLKKEAKFKPIQHFVLPSIALGGTVGAIATVADKDTKNNFSNISQGALIGAGVSGGLTAATIPIAKSKKLRTLFQNLETKTQGKKPW